MRKLGISIGEGTVIRSGVELNLPHIEIGKNVFINYGCQFNTGWGCSYSFVNWEMLSVRPNRGMLTPSH